MGKPPTILKRQEKNYIVENQVLLVRALRVELNNTLLIIKQQSLNIEWQKESLVKNRKEVGIMGKSIF